MSQYPIRIFPKANNFAKYIISHPCSEPFTILVETFIPCLLQFLITVSALDIFDIAQNRLQDIAKERFPTKRRGFRKWLTKQVEQDLRLEAKSLKGVSFLEKKWVQNSTKFLLTVSGPLEKIGFAHLLYSASDEFFYNWQTLLERRAYCQAGAGTGPYSRRDTAGPALYSQTPSNLAITILQQNRSAWVGNALGVNVPQGVYNVIFALKALTLGPIIADAYLQITVFMGGVGPFIFKGDKAAINGDEYTDLICNATFDARLFLSADISWQTASDSAPVGAALYADSFVIVWAEEPGYTGL